MVLLRLNLKLSACGFVTYKFAGTDSWIDCSWPVIEIRIQLREVLPRESHVHHAFLFCGIKNALAKVLTYINKPFKILQFRQEIFSHCNESEHILQTRIYGTTFNDRNEQRPLTHNPYIFLRFKYINKKMLTKEIYSFSVKTFSCNLKTFTGI